LPGTSNRLIQKRDTVFDCSRRVARVGP